MSSFAGRWFTTYGPMELRQDGGRIDGTYWYLGTPCNIAGALDGHRFVFRYQDGSGTGEGWFEHTRFGAMRGQYRLDGGQHWGDWTGQREWDGIWDTSFGRLRITHEESRLVGSYESAGPARIEGTLQDGRLVFRYFEPKVQGEGWFELAPDGRGFHGQWRPHGAPAWGDWQGQRVFPKQGLTWLVVIEAPWQHSLADGEYSYGSMLKEFFARLPHVAVRHRFFNDQVGLERWCRELMYVAEPAIVLISSHGTTDGVSVHGKTIDPRFVVDALRPAGNVELLHFATCLVLQEESPGQFASRIGAAAPFPISGYTTSIDWGGSAVLEFSYFDMILNKGLLPEQAAGALPKLIGYAGADAPVESPYPGVGFRFFPRVQA